MRLPRHGDLSLLHGFEQCGLRLGGRAVDFIREDQIAKDRALLEDERSAGAFAGIDLRAGDVARQQVRRELNPRELTLQILRERLDRARLGEAGQAFHQEMAIGEQRDEQLIHHRLLADDGGGDALLEVEDLVAGGHVI